MAAKLNNEALKKQAIEALEEGRGEITLGFNRVRTELSPRHVAETTVRRHTTGVMVGAAALGLGLALVLFRRPAPAQAPAAAAAALKEEKKPPRPGRKMLTVLFEVAAPILLNKVVVPWLHDYLDQQKREPFRAPRGRQ